MTSALSAGWPDLTYCSQNEVNTPSQFKQTSNKLDVKRHVMQECKKRRYTGGPQAAATERAHNLLYFWNQLSLMRCIHLRFSRLLVASFPGHFEGPPSKVLARFSLASFPGHFKGPPSKLLARFCLWQAFWDILKVLLARSWQGSLCGKLSGTF